MIVAMRLATAAEARVMIVDLRLATAAAATKANAVSSSHAVAGLSLVLMMDMSAPIQTEAEIRDLKFLKARTYMRGKEAKKVRAQCFSWSDDQLRRCCSHLSLCN